MANQPVNQTCRPTLADIARRTTADGKRISMAENLEFMCERGRVVLEGVGPSGSSSRPGKTAWKCSWYLEGAVYRATNERCYEAVQECAANGATSELKAAAEQQHLFAAKCDKCRGTGWVDKTVGMYDSKARCPAGCPVPKPKGADLTPERLR